jgi:hypothetical protein
MTRTSWKDLQSKKLSSMTVEERREYDQAYAEAQLAAEVGERSHVAREAAGLTQRELARRMGTSPGSHRPPGIWGSRSDPHDAPTGRYRIGARVSYRRPLGNLPWCRAIRTHPIG